MMAIVVPDVLLGIGLGMIADRLIASFSKTAKQQGFKQTIKNWWGL